MPDDGVAKLRHRLVLEQPASTKDGDGGFTEAWAALSPGTVWGEVLPADGRDEQLVANIVEGVVTHVVTMRYHSGVTTKTRITHRSRYLYVRGVHNVEERGRWTRCACEERVS